jgi:hypothetical protein
MSERLKKNGTDDAFVSDLTGGSDDLIIAYLELALKIYLRIKNEGKSIHICRFDDEARSSISSSRKGPLPS